MLKWDRKLKKQNPLEFVIFKVRFHELNKSMSMQRNKYYATIPETLTNIYSTYVIPQL